MDLFSILGPGSHVYVVYSTNKMLIDGCFSFLVAGLKNNEDLLLILQNDSKMGLYKKINREFTINNFQEIENADTMNIITPNQWYLNQHNNFNAEKFLKEWESLISKVQERGKKGLRIFIEADTTLIEGFENALIKFDEILADYFSFPITSVYAYKREDIEKMNQQQLGLLNLNHGIVISNSSNIGTFANPLKNHYICLIEDGRNNQRVSSNMIEQDEYFFNKTMLENISDIINEVLIRGGLCIYGDINARNENLSHYLAKNIVDYQENTKDRNFQLFDFSHHYMAALSDDLLPFEEFVKHLNQLVKYSKSSIIYLICDCVGSMFRNKHFERTFNLEKWWIKNLPKCVTRLSIYLVYQFNKSPYKSNVKPIFYNDSTTLLMNTLINPDK